MNTTENLVLAWKERPGRFDPDDTDHLFWVATKLLPALKAAMPAILRLEASQQESAVQTLADDKNDSEDPKQAGTATLATPLGALTDAPAPSSAEQTSPETACSSHSQPESQRTVGIVSGVCQVGGTRDMLASSGATPRVKMTSAEVVAKMTAARKAKRAASAVPPAQPPTTEEVASEDQVPVPPC